MHASFPELICGETVLPASPGLAHPRPGNLAFYIDTKFFFGEAIKHKLAHSGNCKINLKDVRKLLPWPYFVPRAGRREPWERGCDNKPA